MTALVRCLEAQPNLKKQIDLSAVFGQSPKSQSRGDLLLLHLQTLLCPVRESDETTEQKKSRMRFVDSLTINKYSEKEQKKTAMEKLKLRVESSAWIEEFV